MFAFDPSREPCDLIRLAAWVPRCRSVMHSHYGIKLWTAAMPKRTLFSQIPRAHLFRHVVGCAHCECRNCQSWILRATRNETASINNEQILDIVALVPLVKHAGLGVVTHTAASQLMNTFAWRHHLVVLG